MGSPVISRSPEVMARTAVFSGDRVPVQTLLDCLESRESIDDFLAGLAKNANRAFAMLALNNLSKWGSPLTGQVRPA